MTRRSFQQGYVSEAFHTRNGPAFKIRYRVRTTEGGWKHKTETLYGLNGRKAAREILRQRIQQATNVTPEATDLTFRAFVDAYWKPYLERKQVKPSTSAGYQSILDCHVMPVFGDMRLSDIAPLHVEEFLQQKAKRRLSPKTLRNMITMLQGILHLAVDNDLIGRSPIRNRHKPVVGRSEKSSWSAEQVNRILLGVPDDFRALFACVALTGLRLGELLGLQWKHVDLHAKALRVEQSLWHGQLVPPKTAASVRTVPIGEHLSAVLEQHRHAAACAGPEDFVFCKRDGSPLHPDVLRKDVLYPVLDRLGIPRPKRAGGFHGFRHSAASFINSRTGNLKLAQRFLGHSNLSTTADIYTHTSIEEEREAAVALEQAVFQILFPIVPGFGNRKAETVN